MSRRRKAQEFGESEYQVRVIADRNRVLEEMMGIRLVCPVITRILTRTIEFVGEELPFPEQKEPYVDYLTKQVVHAANHAVNFHLAQPIRPKLRLDAAMHFAFCTRALRLSIPITASKIGVKGTAQDLFDIWGGEGVTFKNFRQVRKGQIVTIWDPNSMEVAGYKPPVKRPAPPAPEQDAKKESTDGGRGGRRHRNRADEPEEYESYLAWFAERILWAKPGLKPATEAVANVLFDDRDLDVLDDIIAEHPRIALPPSCL